MKKLDGLLDRIMAEDKAAKARKIFHRCSYWGTWSRTIVSQRLGINAHVGSQYYCVELDLTPVNPQQKGVWEPLRELTFRSHGTSPGRNDEDVEELPPHVVAEMVRWYGEELTRRMLTEDFLPQIDLRALEASPSGGTPLRQIRKDDPADLTEMYDLADEIDLTTIEGYMMLDGLDPDRIRAEYEKGRKRG